MQPTNNNNLTPITTGSQEQQTPADSTKPNSSASQHTSHGNPTHQIPVKQRAIASQAEGTPAASVAPTLTPPAGHVLLSEETFNQISRKAQACDGIGYFLRNMLTNSPTTFTGPVVLNLVQVAAQNAEAFKAILNPLQSPKPEVPPTASIPQNNDDIDADSGLGSEFSGSTENLTSFDDAQPSPETSTSAEPVNTPAADTTAVDTDYQAYCQEWGSSKFQTLEGTLNISRSKLNSTKAIQNSLLSTLQQASDNAKQVSSPTSKLALAIKQAQHLISQSEGKLLDKSSWEALVPEIKQLKKDIEEELAELAPTPENKAPLQTPKNSAPTHSANESTPSSDETESNKNQTDTATKTEDSLNSKETAQTEEPSAPEQGATAPAENPSTNNTGQSINTAESNQDSSSSSLVDDADSAEQNIQLQKVDEQITEMANDLVGNMPASLTPSPTQPPATDSPTTSKKESDSEGSSQADQSAAPATDANSTEPKQKKTKKTPVRKAKAGTAKTSTKTEAETETETEVGLSPAEKRAEEQSKILSKYTRAKTDIIRTANKNKKNTSEDTQKELNELIKNANTILFEFSPFDNNFKPKTFSFDNYAEALSAQLTPVLTQIANTLSAEDKATALSKIDEANKTSTTENKKPAQEKDKPAQKAKKQNIKDSTKELHFNPIRNIGQARTIMKELGKMPNKALIMFEGDREHMRPLAKSHYEKLDQAAQSAIMNLANANSDNDKTNELEKVSACLTAFVKALNEVLHPSEKNATPSWLNPTIFTGNDIKRPESFADVAISITTPMRNAIKKLNNINGTLSKSNHGDLLKEVKDAESTWNRSISDCRKRSSQVQNPNSPAGTDEIRSLLTEVFQHGEKYKKAILSVEKKLKSQTKNNSPSNPSAGTKEATKNTEEKPKKAGTGKTARAAEQTKKPAPEKVTKTNKNQGKKKSPSTAVSVFIEQQREKNEFLTTRDTGNFLNSLRRYFDKLISKANLDPHTKKQLNSDRGNAFKAIKQEHLNQKITSIKDPEQKKQLEVSMVTLQEIPEFKKLITGLDSLESKIKQCQKQQQVKAEKPASNTTTKKPVRKELQPTAARTDTVVTKNTDDRPKPKPRTRIPQNETPNSPMSDLLSGQTSQLDSTEPQANSTPAILNDAAPIPAPRRSLQTKQPETGQQITATGTTPSASRSMSSPARRTPSPGKKKSTQPAGNAKQPASTKKALSNAEKLDKLQKDMIALENGKSSTLKGKTNVTKNQFNDKIKESRKLWGVAKNGALNPRNIAALAKALKEAKAILTQK